MKDSGFKKLKIWQKGIEISTTIYQLTRKFPEDERFGLVAQMRRSAVSIPSNVAEGYSRKNSREFRQFLYIALGSLGELETQMILGVQLGWVQESHEVFDSMDHVRSMILKWCHKSDEFRGTRYADRGSREEVRNEKSDRISCDVDVDAGRGVWKA